LNKLKAMTIDTVRVVSIGESAAPINVSGLA